MLARTSTHLLNPSAETMNHHKAKAIDVHASVESNARLLDDLRRMLGTLAMPPNSIEGWRQIGEDLREFASRIDSLSASVDVQSKGVERIMGTSIGKIYQAIGDVVLDSAGGLNIRLLRSPLATTEADLVIRSITTDVANGHCVTLNCDEHIVSEVPSDQDLDAIAEAICIRSKGELLMTHSCPSLSKAGG